MQTLQNQLITKKHTTPKTTSPKKHYFEKNSADYQHLTIYQ